MVYTHIYTHICLYISACNMCIYMNKSMSSCWSISPNHSNHAYLQTATTKVRNLVPIILHSSSRIDNPHLWGWRRALSTNAQCLCILSFEFNITDSTHFQSYLGQNISTTPTTLNEVVVYICDAVRLLCHILHSIFESPTLYMIFF